MKYLIKMAYYLGLIGWFYYLVKFATVDNFDMQIFYGVKMLVYFSIVYIVNIVKRSN